MNNKLILSIVLLIQPLLLHAMDTSDELSLIAKTNANEYSARMEIENDSIKNMQLYQATIYVLPKDDMFALALKGLSPKNPNGSVFDQGGKLSYIKQTNNFSKQTTLVNKQL